VELKQGFKLGSFEVRPLTGEVSGADGTAHLEPKVMEVLAALAQRPGEVVEREELLARVWGARAAVADEPLTRCIAELRRVLGDSRQTPVFIQTIPKSGYRLIAGVSVNAEHDLAASRHNGGASLRFEGEIIDSARATIATNLLDWSASCDKRDRGRATVVAQTRTLTHANT